MKPTSSISHKESRTVAFRVTPEQYEMIQMLADISGMVKQDYLLSRALQTDITVYPNVRIRKYLEQYLCAILEELRRLQDTPGPDILDRLDVLIRMISSL